MIDLSNITLLDLLPPNFNNAHTVALSRAVAEQFKQLNKNAENVLVYPRIDQLDHSELNDLAEQFSVNGYENTFDLIVKRRLVKNCLIVAMRAGTLPAITEKVAAVFGDAILEEWFDYSGEPYYFKILTSNPGANKEMVKRFKDLIENTKREAAKLEIVIAKSLHEYFVPVDIQTVLQMRSALYPRNNNARLYLDGGWLLDGISVLNGYFQGRFIDLYPLRMIINSGIAYNIGLYNAYAVETNCNIGIKANSVTTLRGSNICEITAKNQTTMAINAVVATCVDSILTVEKDLWYLDGGELLGGAKYLDAEVIIYDNL